MSKTGNYLREAILARARIIGEFSSHPVITGSSREFVVKNILQTFIPRKYELLSGTIIKDEKNNRQVDLMLVDTWTYPIVYREKDIAICLPESIKALVESKSKLSSPEFAQTFFQMTTAMYELFIDSQQAPRAFLFSFDYGSEAIISQSIVKKAPPEIQEEIERVLPIFTHFRPIFGESPHYQRYFDTIKSHYTATIKDLTDATSQSPAHIKEIIKCFYQAHFLNEIDAFLLDVGNLFQESMQIEGQEYPYAQLITDFTDRISAVVSDIERVPFDVGFSHKKDEHKKEIKKYLDVVLNFAFSDSEQTSLERFLSLCQELKPITVIEQRTYLENIYHQIAQPIQIKTLLFREIAQNRVFLAAQTLSKNEPRELHRLLQSLRDWCLPKAILLLNKEPMAERCYIFEDKSYLFSPEEHKLVTFLYEFLCTTTTESSDSTNKYAGQIARLYGHRTAT